MKSFLPRGAPLRVMTSTGSSISFWANSPGLAIVADARMKRGDEPRAYALLADQTPLAKVPKHWIRFLNRDTAFFLGPERIARYLDASVVYVAMKRVRRGYYDVHIDVIAEPPYDDDAGPAIAEAYARHLEATILASPADWLWIHNKWKYPKPADAARPRRRQRT